MKAENPSLALRPREAAKALGISERLLWDWTRCDIVPHVKIGRTVLYPVAGLMEWLRARSEAPKTEGGSDASA